MSPAHGDDGLFQRVLGTDRFQTPLGNLFPPALLAHRGMCEVRAEERSRSGLAKTALAVVPDVSRAGGKECVGYACQVAIRDKDHQLVERRVGTAAQRAHLVQ